MRVGIVNVTGYAGADLARLLRNHPKAELVSVTGRSAAGQRLGDVFPHLADVDLPIEAELAPVDVAFLALPHVASAEATPPLLAAGAIVVDISADFRLHDAGEYRQWYGHTHPCPDLLPKAAYGLVELNRERIREARLIANPGCYPTSAILAMAPALKLGLVGPDVIVDSKSGVSGAGRTLRLNIHFSEANENVSAYGLEGHRHLPEIAQGLRDFGQAPDDLRLTFTPHLIPMTRGILSTCYADLRDRSLTTAAVREQYSQFYAGEPFVRVVAQPPQTKQTLGSNVCLIHPVVDSRTGRLIVVSCIDNLVKGAAGQAIQNMNLICGFPETMGLEALAVYP
ncbi:MAG: N-acetyl-gamma-glutamyl-phosphate reductase [Chloroflexi bacterium]|nr:N-acetyl-gamma-glutamyl-phosphate reductase [Chloroflexota bacterium]